MKRTSFGQFLDYQSPWLGIMVFMIVMLLAPLQWAKAQENAVSGKVTGVSGEPIPGVTVRVKGDSQATTTDRNGDYVLGKLDREVMLTFSLIGMKTQEIAPAGRHRLDVVMEAEAGQLDEVVVIGYGTAQRKDLTGAIASVNLDRVENVPNINIAQTMRGTVAGVTVTDNGRPGSNPAILIRGTNSISASNDPLIVLDGVIYRGGSLTDINPGDIESIDILKDASSTAIYGSLAANGVIEITTKKGTTIDPQILLHTYYGSADYAHLPDYLNAEEYLRNRAYAEQADNGSLPFQPIEVENIAAGKTIDPFKAISQDAPIWNSELSVSGTAKNLTYYLSGSFMDSHSPVAGDNFKRTSGRANLNFSATDWLKIGLHSGYTAKDNSGFRANLLQTTYLSPYASLYYDDGVPRKQPMDIGLGGNPVIDHALNANERINKTFFLNSYLNVDLPVEGLSYRLNVGLTTQDNHDFSYKPSYSRDGFYNLGSGSKYYYSSNNLTLENIINYNRTVGKHAFKATLMYGIYEAEDESSELSSKNIFNDALGWNSLEIGDSYALETGAGKDQQVSAMGRLGYIYNHRYIFDISLRRDGYSAFGDGRKYGLFPAVGASWNVSEESFLSDAAFLDNLKLRLSWGKNGNRGVSRYSALSNMTETYYVFGPNTAAGQYVTSMANPKLGWETTTSTNLAIDFSVLSNRISGSLDVYTSKTTDLLLSQSIPNTNGFNRFLRNVGEVSNQGMEISLNTKPLVNKDFTWSVDFAFTHNRNKILKLTGADFNEDGIEDDDIASGWFIGHSLGSNYDYVFDGIYQEGDDFSLQPDAKPGYIRFKDISGPDGVPDGVITPDDRTVLHNNRPKYTLGVTNTLSFRGLSLMAVLFYRNGGYTANTSTVPGINFYDVANYMDVPYWTPENPSNEYPAINYRNPLNYGFYQPRSFVRLQDVSLAYSFPSGITKKIRLKNVQVYASGKNLITWTDWKGWDPEFGAGSRDPGANGPIMKIYTAGLRVQL